MHDALMMPYDPDPRRAWRQWVKASDQWHQRFGQFLQDQEPIPVSLLLGSSRALTKALLAQRAAERIGKTNGIFTLAPREYPGARC